MDVTEEEIKRMGRRSRCVAIELTLHILVGTGCFSVIILAAYYLQLLVELLETTQIATWFIALVTAAKYALGVTDIGFFLVFLVYSAISAIKRL
jgi:hypothetical protein